MKVLFVTSEVAGVYKKGGLADVSYSLPVALSKRRVRVSVVMPYYDAVRLRSTACVGQLAVEYDRRRELVFVFASTLPGTDIPLYLFRHPLFLSYDAKDMVARFGLFSKAVALMYAYSGTILGGPYDIVHCNDWHTGLLPLFLGESKKYGRTKQATIQSRAAKTVFTIHNLLYQGEAGIGDAGKLGISSSLIHPFTTPMGRAVRLLVEGMSHADVVTTVSPTYAKEVMSGDHGAMARDIIKQRGDALVGILNGIDQDLWDPSTDQSLPKQYTKETVVAGKRANKALLQHAVGLPESDVPLFGFVGRLERRQKGVDIIIKAVKHLSPSAFQLVLLGTGDPDFVSEVTEAVSLYPSVSFLHTFDERLARRMYAGCDCMLVPSKFEPCGLTQLIAMRYGTIPLVRKTGGLADTVKHDKTGFVFSEYTATALADAMRHAIDVYTDTPKQYWDMVHRAIDADFSWDTEVSEYKSLYTRILKR